MADLQHADVTVLHSWHEGTTTGRKFYAKRVQFTYNAADDQVAAAFGMTEITDVSGAYNVDNSEPNIAAPEPDGSKLVVHDAAGAEIDGEVVTLTVRGFPA